MSESSSSLLSRKELTKTRARSCKWLSCLAKSLSPLDAYTAPPAASADASFGFIVLNAGVQTGASPFALRQTLVELAELLDDSFIIRFSSVLPFALVAPCAGCVLPHRVANTTSIAVPMAPHGNGEADVLALPVPHGGLWSGGSSTHGGSSFVFLVRCRASSVLQSLSHVFQPPAVGLDLLPSSFPSPSAGSAVGDGEGSEADGGVRPRVLGGVAVASIPGLYVFPDFLTPSEHDAVWRELHEGRTATEMEVESLARRRVAHFNRRFYYGVNKLGASGDSVNAPPAFYEWMRRRLSGEDRCVVLRGAPPAALCDQLTINFYDYNHSHSGGDASGIAHHVDAHSPFSDFVLIVSLGSHTVMEFSRYDRPPDGAAPIPVLMAPRSLVVMTGEARYAWTHGIAEKRVDILSDRTPPLRRENRVSLTWRRGREGVHRRDECICKELCDGE